MKKFIIRLLLFVAIPLLPLYFLNYIVDSGLKKSHSFFYPEWNDLFSSKINADLIVLGSSRAWVHVSPKILDSELHLNSYNLGLDGTQFMMQYERYKLYNLYNKRPKYVVLTVDFHMFTEDKGLMHYQQYLPYLSNPRIRALTEEYKGRFGFFEYYFPLYKYNNELPIISEGIKSYFGKGVRPTKYKGYEGQNKKWSVSAKVDSHIYRFFVDSNSLTHFHEFLADAGAHGTKVFLVFAPYQKNVPNKEVNKDRIFKIMQAASQKYNMPFFDYTDDELCVDTNNFYNYSHLNKKGAEAFTHKLANEIKPYLR